MIVGAREHANAIYRLVRGWPAYAVGSDGSLWCRSWLANRRASDSQYGPWRAISGETHTAGYVRVMLGYRNNRRVRKYLHRLVLEAFVGQCPEGMQCRHLNGNAGDNRIDNLQWGTPSENNWDLVRHGTHARAGGNKPGERNSRAKLKNCDIPVIRKRLANGEHPRDIGKDFGVTEWCIWGIRHNRTWTTI